MNKKYLYILLSMIPVFIGIVGFLTLWQSPYTGLHFELKNDKCYIKSIDKDSPASKYSEMQGHEVASIAGWKISNKDLSLSMDVIKDQKDFFHFLATQQYLSKNIRINSSFDITFIQGNEIKTISVMPSTMPLYRVLIKVGTLMSIGIVFIILSIIIVLKQENDIRSRIFFLMGMMGSLTYFALSIYKNRDIGFDYSTFLTLYILAGFGIYYGFVGLWHFCASFPKKTIFAKNKILIIGIYILPIIVGVLEFFRIYYTLSALFLSILLLWAIIILLYNYFTVDFPIEKAQVRWVVWGVGVFTFMEAVFCYIPSFFLGHLLIPSNILMLFGILIPLSMAFAIMKYKLMDIDTLFDNTLIYSVTIGLLALVDVVVIYVLTSNKIPLLVFKEPFPTIIAVWVIIFTYLPIRNRVRDVIKRLLKREMYDLNDVSTLYSKSLLSAYSTDDVTKMAKDVIERTLHPKRIEIDILDTPRDLQPLVNTEAGETFIPLLANTGAIGLIELGEKHSGRLYDRNDIKLLDTIANQTALAIESIRHREGIRLREEENRQEKERISKEIHDGIGSSLVQAKLLLNMAGKDPAVIHEAANVIDSGIKEMRELIWVVEQDEQTLGDLVYHIEGRLEQAKNILNINIETKIENENIILTPEQKLNISRIVQESMTNIIKHAQASRVDISFTQQGEHFTIIIKDNGKGFDTSKTSIESYGLRNMRARAEKIGAQFDISSEPSRGSEIKIFLTI